MAFVSSNWKALVREKKVDPVNSHPAALHRAKKKRRLEQQEAEGSSSDRTARSIVSSSQPSPASSPSVLSRPPTSPAVPTAVIAMDCEMVGVGGAGRRHALARCSIVNASGAVLLDRYVRPVEDVTDYRTAISGITPQLLSSANAACVDLQRCQREVSALLDRRLLVGHGLKSDLTVLLLSHPRAMQRDTSRWSFLCPERPRSLKALALQHLSVEIQRDQHDSVVDARTALALYLKYSKQWELSIKQRRRGAADAKGSTEPSHDQATAAAAAIHEYGDTVLYTAEDAAADGRAMTAIAPATDPDVLRIGKRAAKRRFKQKAAAAHPQRL